MNKRTKFVIKNISILVIAIIATILLVKTLYVGFELTMCSNEVADTEYSFSAGRTISEKTGGICCRNPAGKTGYHRLAGGQSVHGWTLGGRRTSYRPVSPFLRKTHTEG